MCDEKVLVDVRKDGSAIKIPCGQSYMTKDRYCPKCMDKLNKRYPQGWAYYPGDVCKHGCYVGGCGEDNMCFYCEQGTEPYVPEKIYVIQIIGNDMGAGEATINTNEDGFNAFVASVGINVTMMGQVGMLSYAENCVWFGAYWIEYR